MQQESSPQLQEEIKELEKRLKEKKEALGQTEAGLEDKEIFHQAVGERIQEHIPDYRPKEKSVRASNTEEAAGDVFSDPEVIEKVQDLVNIVFSKDSLSEGIKAAKDLNSGLNDMAIVDAFHRTLTDQLYDTLVERKKLEEIKQ